MTDAYTLTYMDGPATLRQCDEILALYLDGYAEPPYDAGIIWQSDALADRIHGQATRPGFAAVAARHRDTLIGHAFGVSCGQAEWWPRSTPPPQDLAPLRKFAVLEIVVARAFRRAGVGRGLLRALLLNRPEAYAMLTALPDTPARDLYRNEGWRQIGVTHAAPGSPAFDVLVLPLPLLDE